MAPQLVLRFAHLPARQVPQVYAQHDDVRRAAEGLGKRCERLMAACNHNQRLPELHHVGANFTSFHGWQHSAV